MKVLLLSGEESGVLYAKGIAERLRRARPDVEIRGFGDYGFETHDLAVMGFAAVLSRIFYFLKVKKTLERAIDAWRPDVVCTVDYPGMNLKLAAYAKARGIRTVHVVCPQVWAWKAGRIPKIEASLDCLCCFFPFEPKLFKPGFATFVGHPLAAEFGNRKASAARGRPLLAVLPGSRHGEIERLLPTLAEAVKGLDADVVIPAATDRAYAQINEMLRGISASVTVQKGGARELLQKADCAVVASGTATLEAALARCPTVLVYRVGRLLGWFARRVIKGIRHVGLANIVWEKCAGAGAADEAPMPELLQEDFTAANVRARLGRWLESPAAREEARRRLDAAMAFLEGEGDPLGRVVSRCLDVV